MNESETIAENTIEIVDLPRLPQGVIQAYKDRELVVFIGAGISRLMGCMGWDDMANKLIKAVYPPGTATQIIDSKLDSKAKITIARKASKDTEKEKAFWEVFEEAICYNDNTDKKDIYKTIARLGTTFVTTNCDGMLIKYFPNLYTTVCSEDSWRKIEEDKPFVFCIHGNYRDGKDMEKRLSDKYPLPK